MIACPGCGANLTFDISSQQMKCGYCGNIYDPYRFDNMEKDADESLVFDVWVYNCPFDQRRDRPAPSQRHRRPAGAQRRDHRRICQLYLLLRNTRRKN